MADAKHTYIYLSGPMTGLKDKNFPAFDKAASKLRTKGHRVISPAELSVDDVNRPWSECLRRDVRVMMINCSSVATLPGWKKSKGACLEVYLAKQLGWPVHSVNYYLKHKPC